MNINKPYKCISELPVSIPVFPLAGVLLIPKGQLSLNIFEPRYLEMFDAAMCSHRMIGMIQPLSDQSQSGQEPKLETVGCVGKVIQIFETGDGRYQTVLSGVMRFRTLYEHPSTMPYRQFQVAYDEFEDDLAIANECEDLDRDGLLLVLKKFGKTRDIKFDHGAVNKLSTIALINLLSMNLPFGSLEKQALLEAKNFKDRLESLIGIMEWDIERNGQPNGRLQ